MNQIVQTIPEFSDAEFATQVDVVSLRSAFGWSQAELAEEIGNSRATIARWENGDEIPIWARRFFWRLFHELKLGLRQPKEAVAAKKARASQ